MCDGPEGPLEGYGEASEAWAEGDLEEFGVVIFFVGRRLGVLRVDNFGRVGRLSGCRERVAPVAMVAPGALPLSKARLKRVEVSGRTWEELTRAPWEEGGEQFLKSSVCLHPLY